MIDGTRDALRGLWFEPRAPKATGPGRADFMLVCVAVLIAGIEITTRPEVSWSSPSALISVVLFLTLLWRRQHPLATLLVTSGTSTLMELAWIEADRPFPGLFISALLVLIPYSVFRWGSGREAIIGLPVMVASVVFGLTAKDNTAGEVVGAFAVMSSAVAFGRATRYRIRERARQIEQMKLLERERLARDLHDTVAHHVSAIAVRAQAGLAVSSVDANAAREALGVIAAESTRTLAEMRMMVRSLRQDESAEFSPNPQIQDLVQLAEDSAGGPRVVVEICGEVEAVSASVSTATYRLAQESITNVRRHARNATRIEVIASVDKDNVRLRVHDDGDQLSVRTVSSAGYGVIGMIERAELLGGTCQAGPGPKRGWTVEAVLPRGGPRE